MPNASRDSGATSDPSAAPDPFALRRCSGRPRRPRPVGRLEARHSPFNPTPAREPPTRGQAPTSPRCDRRSDIPTSRVPAPTRTSSTTDRSPSAARSTTCQACDGSPHTHYAGLPIADGPPKATSKKSSPKPPGQAATTTPPNQAARDAAIGGETLLYRAAEFVFAWQRIFPSPSWAIDAGAAVLLPDERCSGQNFT